MALAEDVKDLLDRKSFAVASTLMPDGAPQFSVGEAGWRRRPVHDDDRARQKARNLARDPRVSLTVFDAEKPYRTVEMRGRAELSRTRKDGCPGS